MHLKNVYRPLAGVGLLLMSGCYAPYGGYPPGAYAPQGGAPMQFQGVPQSSYVMPGDALGSPSSGSPSSGSPSSGSPSSGSDGAPSTFAPGGNIQAPDPTARGAGGSSSSPVPLPRDPDPAAAKPEGAQTSQFGLPSDPPEVSLGSPAELGFQSPVILAGTSDRPAGAVVTASAQSTTGGSQNHDLNYNWFQGRLEYVESDRTWHLTYDDAPTTADQLGGDISLSSDVKLDSGHNGAIVRVSGQFDAIKLDRLGKPIFRVSRIDPVRN